MATRKNNTDTERGKAVTVEGDVNHGLHSQPIDDQIADTNQKLDALRMLASDEGAEGEKIMAAYELSKSLALSAVTAAIIAGGLLLKQRQLVEEGEWIQWLTNNCKNADGTSMSRMTANKLMRAAEYAAKCGQVEATTVRQLYIEAGAIHVDDPEDGEGSTKLEPTIITPFKKAFEAVKLNYADVKLDRLSPYATNYLCTWVKKLKAELQTLEDRLASRLSQSQ